MNMKQAQIIFTILAVAVFKEKVSTLTPIDSNVKYDLSSPINENVEQPISSSYVQKFSQSWNYFAKANDISKRERLKKALSDALQSMEFKKRNDIAVNINNESVSRIKHAAKLLKEFREMYSLSDKVKKTLQEYSKARQDLRLIANSEASVSILKRFLDLHSHKDNKRTNIPYASTIGLNGPKYLKRTDTVSLKAVPLDKPGKIGLEFSSIDTRSSSMKRAIDAFRAAKIILNYETTIRSHIHSKPFLNKTFPNNLDMDSALKFIQSSNKRSGFPDLLDFINSTNITNDVNNNYTNVNLSTKSNNETEYKTSSNETLNNETTDSKTNSGTAYEATDTSNNSPAANETIDTANNIGITDKTIATSYNSGAMNEISNNNGTIHETTDTTSNGGTINKTIDTTDNNGGDNETSDTTNDIQTANEILDTTNNSQTANEMLNTKNNSGTADITLETTNTSGTDSIENDLSNNSSHSNITNDLSKKIKPFVELLKKIGVKNFLEKMKTMNTRNHVNSRDNMRLKINTVNKMRTEVPNSNFPSNELINSHNADDKTKSLNENTKETIDQINHEEDLIRKEKITAERLKEAKIARQKYEIAKHELAKKVKELYDLANDFEKEETQDQFLEVKKSSTSIPVAINQNNEQRIKYDEVKSVSIKRSDSHPGIALAGILHKEPILNNDKKFDSINKGLTMGMIDKSAHQVKLDEAKTVTDGHLNAKVNALDDLPKDSNSEETFKQITQAINVGISKISKDDVKGKSLLKVVSLPGPTDTKQSKNVVLTITNSTNKDSISNGHSTENIDEFLTKALSDILSNSSSQTKDSMIKSKDLEPSKQNEENRKIVEKAMKAHAANPHVELPLLKKNGDTIVPNKDAKLENQKDREKVNQLIFPTSIFNNSPKNSSAQNEGLTNSAEENLAKLVEEDPNNKALLDKASHMEEQVAAAQERLFSTLTDSPEKTASLPIIGSSVLTSNLVKGNAHSTSDEIFPQTSMSHGFTDAENNGQGHTFSNSNNDQPLRYVNNDIEGDPYSSIKEENLPYGIPLTRHSSQEEGTPEEEDDDDEEEPYRVSRRKHHHHHYMPEPDEDDDGNEDDEYDDEEDSPYDDKRKRTLLNKLMLSNKNKTISGIHNFIPSRDISHNSSNEFLEDENKKSVILGGKKNTQVIKINKSAKN